MRKVRILQRISLIIGLGLIIWVFIGAQLSAHLWTIKDHEIYFEYPENQMIVNELATKKTVEEFLTSQADSAAIRMDLHLLETSLEALPFVAEAQVYWNLNRTLVVELRATQARAKVFMEQSKYLLTQGGVVLPAPKSAQIDLMICTGLHDSAEAAQAAHILDIIEASKCYDLAGLSQIHFEEDQISITPRGAVHSITSNRDERLVKDLTKLAAFYATKSDEELGALRHLDLRFKNQVVTTVQ